MNLANYIKALLFVAGEPLSIARLCKILKKDETEIHAGIDELEENLKNSGLRLLKKDNEIMLGTATECSKYCESLIKEELDKNIGKAGLETLAVILYKEETSRGDIDYIRGVNSTFTLRNLLIRGLIERKINLKDKRSYLYKPSMQLFQYLGITKREDLPDFNISFPPKADQPLAEKQIKDALESS